MIGDSIDWPRRSLAMNACTIPVFRRRLPCLTWPASTGRRPARVELLTKCQFAWASNGVAYGWHVSGVSQEKNTVRPVGFTGQNEQTGHGDVPIILSILYRHRKLVLYLPIKLYLYANITYLSHTRHIFYNAGPLSISCSSYGCVKQIWHAWQLTIYPRYNAISMYS